jgi:hypothetical protein
MKKFAITALSLMFTLLFGTDVLSQSWKTYNTKKNPRAQGVRLSVDYPSEHELSLDQKNYMVAAFLDTKNYYNMVKILDLRIIGDPNVLQDRAMRNAFLSYHDYDLCSIPDSEMIRSIFKMHFHKGVSVNPKMKRRSVNGVCGINYSTTDTYYAEGFSLFAAADYFQLGYMNKTVGAPRYVVLTCHTIGLVRNKSFTERVHKNDSAGLCSQYFNSLKIYDR